MKVSVVIRNFGRTTDIFVTRESGGQDYYAVAGTTDPNGELVWLRQVHTREVIPCLSCPTAIAKEIGKKLREEFNEQSN